LLLISFFCAGGASALGGGFRISGLSPLSLPLFVFGVLADDADDPFAADNLAVVADLLD
jgi:hypothetical protein